MASAIVLWLPDGPMEIGHLIHHMQQCLSSLFVFEWRVEAVRSEPTLCPVRVDSHEIRILFDLYREIERRKLPPIDRPASSSSDASHASGIYLQTTASMYTCLPPVDPLGGSLRGTYSSLRT